MAKARKGDIYAAFNKVMGKAGPTTKLKKQTAAKPVGGGGKGGSSGGGRPKGSGKSGGAKMAKMKSGARGGSRGSGKGRSKGLRQSAPKGVGQDTRKTQPDSQRAQKMIDDAVANEQPQTPRDPNLPESGPGSEGGRHGLRKSRAEADAANAQRAVNAEGGPPAGTPQDIPPVDESMPPRPAAGSSSAPDRSIPPVPGYRRPNRSYTAEGYLQSKKPSRESKNPMTTEQELGMVHDAIVQPTPADIEELMSDPQRHIKLFIESFGEDNVPLEVWSMLEAPTGPPPPMPQDMPMPMPSPRDEDFAPIPMPMPRREPAPMDYPPEEEEYVPSEGPKLPRKG